MEDLRLTSRIDAIAQRFVDMPGGLLPALHALQHEFGYVDPAAVPVLADVFNLSIAEVHGVITFYTDFRTTRPAGPIVQICRAEACQARGADAVVDRARQVVDAGAAVELAEVFCLGNCALGPSAATTGQAARSARSRRGRTVLIIDACSPARPAHAGRGTIGRRRSIPSRSTCPSMPRHDRPVPTRSPRRWPRVPDVRVVRNGSRGMLWLEPMIEVATADGPRRLRTGHRRRRVDDLLAAGVLTGGEHPLRLGVVDELPWLPPADRVTFRRVGVIDPRSAVDYESHGGLVGLRRALSMAPAEVVTEVHRVGPARPWRRSVPDRHQVAHGADAPGDTKYIVCNADEGDSGTFADRMLIEGDPFALIEGMVIAGYAVGADDGYVYIRSRVPRRHRRRCTRRSLPPTAHGWLGDDVLGSRVRVPHARPRRRRRLHLRRRDGDAREPRGSTRRRARQATAAGARGSVRPADRGQQRADAGHRAGDPGRRCRRATRRSAPVAAVAHRCSSWPATSPTAASSRPRSASPSTS